MFQLIGLLMIGSGAMSFFKPEWSWYLSYGWQFKNAEPSDVALLVTKVAGIISVIIGIVFMTLEPSAVELLMIKILLARPDQQL